MAKQDYSRKTTPPSDNPFAALSGLSNLPPPPDNLPQQEDLGGDAGESFFSDTLRVHLDRKQRRGKTATLIKGFTGPDDALQALSKELKVACGVGGAVKDGEIILQGDHRDRVVELLREKGYRDTKKSG